MTPVMGLFLRLLLAVVLLLVLLFLTEDAFAAKTVEAAHCALEDIGPQAGHILQLWRVFLFACIGAFGAMALAVPYVLWRRPRARPDDGQPT